MPYTRRTRSPAAHTSSASRRSSGGRAASSTGAVGSSPVHTPADTPWRTSPGPWPVPCGCGRPRPTRVPGRSFRRGGDGSGLRRLVPRRRPGRGGPRPAVPGRRGPTPCGRPPVRLRPRPSGSGRDVGPRCPRRARVSDVAHDLVERCKDVRKDTKVFVHEAGQLEVWLDILDPSRIRRHPCTSAPALCLG